jgi:hypothetical protein
MPSALKAHVSGGQPPNITNPKSEARRPKEGRNPKPEFSPQIQGDLRWMGIRVSAAVIAPREVRVTRTPPSEKTTAEQATALRSSEARDSPAERRRSQDLAARRQLRADS